MNDLDDSLFIPREHNYIDPRKVHLKSVNQLRVKRYLVICVINVLFVEAIYTWEVYAQ